MKKSVFDQTDSDGKKKFVKFHEIKISAYAMNGDEGEGVVVGCSLDAASAPGVSKIMEFDATARAIATMWHAYIKMAEGVMEKNDALDYLAKTVHGAMQPGSAAYERYSEPEIPLPDKE